MDEASSRRDAGEVLTAGLLAAATVASAWCAYQAALWSGDQIRKLAQASTAHFESLRQTNEASADLTVDVATFFNLVQSEARGEHKATAYIRDHARLEFRPALDQWIERAKAEGAAARPPFAPPGYRLAAKEKAEALSKEADGYTAEANEANSHADLFVLHTVLFAMALFFLGSATSARRRGVRLAMTTLGALVLILSVISMARLPRAPTAPTRSELRAVRDGRG